MKNLLVLTPRYPHEHDSVSGSFVYSQIEYLRAKFERIVVISTTPFVPRIWSRWLNPRSVADAWASSYSYDNVDVYFPRDLVIPFDPFQRFRINTGYSSVRKILKNAAFDPDLVHAHFLWPSGAIATKLKTDLGIKYVVTAHGYDVYDLPFRSKYYSDSLQRVLDEADAIITVAKELRTSLISRFHLRENRVTLIPNGFDPKLFYPADQHATRTKLRLPLKEKLILSVGNSQYQKTPKGTVEVKGHSILSEAFCQLSISKKDVICGIVGNVPDREISPQAKTMIQFRLFGSRPHDQIPDWINACDVFALSSLKEGLPTVLLEALGCGKPIVATRVGGVPDVITSDKVGILVEPGDSAALKTALEAALDTHWDKEYLFEYSRQYSWEQISNRIYEVYSALA